MQRSVITMSDHDYSAILNEMQFEIIDNGVLELPSSTPAVLEWETKPEVDIDRFESNLEEHGHAPHSTLKETDGDEFYYKTKILTDHAKDVILKADANTVRLFHKGENVDVYEISRIINSLEKAFDADLNFDACNE